MKLYLEGLSAEEITAKLKINVDNKFVYSNQKKMYIFHELFLEKNNSALVKDI